MKFIRLEFWQRDLVLFDSICIVSCSETRVVHSQLLYLVASSHQLICMIGVSVNVCFVYLFIQSASLLSLIQSQKRERKRAEHILLILKQTNQEIL